MMERSCDALTCRKTNVDAQVELLQLGERNLLQNDALYVRQLQRRRPLQDDVPARDARPSALTLQQLILLNFSGNRAEIISDVVFCVFHLRILSFETRAELCEPFLNLSKFKTVSLEFMKLSKIILSHF